MIFRIIFSDFIHTELYTSHKELLILRFDLYFGSMENRVGSSMNQVDR